MSQTGVAEELPASARKGKRLFLGVMAAALILGALPTVLMWMRTGLWIGLGRQLVLLALLGAFIRAGADWARWGLAAWFGFYGIMWGLAGFGASDLSLRPSASQVVQSLIFSAGYIGFAGLFALSFGMDDWLGHVRTERCNRRPESHVS